MDWFGFAVHSKFEIRTVIIDGEYHKEPPLIMPSVQTDLSKMRVDTISWTLGAHLIFLYIECGEESEIGNVQTVCADSQREIG